jgi:hypothetical protein
MSLSFSLLPSQQSQLKSSIYSSRSRKGKGPTYATMTTSSAKAGLRWYAALSPAAHGLACPTHKTHTQCPHQPVTNLGDQSKGEGKGKRSRDPHGYNGRCGARRRVEMPQQDPLPVDRLLHCSFAPLFLLSPPASRKASPLRQPLYWCCSRTGGWVGWWGYL